MKRNIYYFAGGQKNQHSWGNIALILLGLVFVSTLFLHLYHPNPSATPITQQDLLGENITITIKVDTTTSSSPPTPPVDTYESSNRKQIAEKWYPLVETNADIVGWITVADTTIDYPVMQSEDNTKYLDLDFNCKPSIFGTPFLDVNVDISSFSQNIVLYGHSINGSELMGQLHKFLDQSYFDSNKTIQFNTLYEDNLYEILAVCLIDTGINPIVDYTRTTFFHDDLLMDYIDSMIALSSVTTSSSYSAKDSFLTIQTCSKLFRNAKLVVVAKMIP